MHSDNTAKAAHSTIQSLQQLPPLSAVATRLLEEATREDADLHRLARLIEQDPGLAARIIGIANSAYFQRHNDVCTVADAIIRVLGLNLVRSLAIGIALSQPFDASRCPEFDVGRYWYQAMTTATLASRLAPHLRVEHSQLECLFLAGLLQTLGLRPRRTIRVVLFANEENGLAGGVGYRDAHREELPRHLLALESDSGVFAPRGFETNANPEAKAVLDAIAAILGRTAGAGLMAPGGGGADIGPLRPHGVIQVGFLPDPGRYFDLHHTEEDTLEKVNRREIDLGAGVIAALLYVVADLEQPLPRNAETAEG